MEKIGIEIKHELVNKCLSMVEEKLQMIDNELDILQKSANEETKSSAGDKYETGRAMIMLEKEKFLKQKEQSFLQLKALKTIDVDKLCKEAESGSIVYTSGFNYFIATGIGKVETKEGDFLVLSALAPVAQAMLGKAVDDEFSFNNTKVQVKRIL